MWDTMVESLTSTVIWISTYISTSSPYLSILTYWQTLLRGLKAVAQKPTNMANIYNIRQGLKESPAVFMERVIEAFRQSTPMDPQSQEGKTTVAMAFINQSASNIRRKLQRLERLGEKSLQDLMVVGEKVL